MEFSGNVGDLSKRIKICLYMGYPMWAEVYELSDLQDPIEYVVGKFFLGLIPQIKSIDPSFFGEGTNGILVQTQLIILINQMAELTGSPKSGAIQVDQALMSIVDGSWSSAGGDDDLAGGDDDLAGGLPEYELRLKVLSLISQYTDAVISGIRWYYFGSENARLAVPFVLDFPYPYPYGYGYGYGFSGYGYGYGYGETDNYFELIEQF